MHITDQLQSWLSGRAQNSQACQPEFAPQAALIIAIRLTKLVAPPNGSSIAKLC